MKTESLKEILDMIEWASDFMTDTDAKALTKAECRLVSEHIHALALESSSLSAQVREQNRMVRELCAAMSSVSPHISDSILEAFPEFNSAIASARSLLAKTTPQP